MNAGSAARSAGVTSRFQKRVKPRPMIGSVCGRHEHRGHAAAGALVAGAPPRRSRSGRRPCGPSPPRPRTRARPRRRTPPRRRPPGPRGRRGGRRGRRRAAPPARTASEQPRPYSGLVHVWASPTAWKPSDGGGPSSSTKRRMPVEQPAHRPHAAERLERPVAEERGSGPGRTRQASSKRSGSASAARSSPSALRTARVTDSVPPSPGTARYFTKPRSPPSFGSSVMSTPGGRRYQRETYMSPLSWTVSGTSTPSSPRARPARAPDGRWRATTTSASTVGAVVRAARR